MLILTIRTDKPEAEIGLFDDQKQLEYLVWMAHRELAETLHIQIQNMLNRQSKHINDVEAIAVFRGPGSFTGLRIGASVANALSYGLSVPILSENGENWIHDSISRIISGENDEVVVPEYGSLPNITKQIK